MGKSSESALVSYWKNDNPRVRARAFWALVKLVDSKNTLI
jgi:hypothetical protein